MALKWSSVRVVHPLQLYTLNSLSDGRWVVDDYDEEKALKEVTEKGLKPGDLVGDLQETSNIAAEAAALNATASRDAGKPDRSGGLGIYRAGGPTTIFGGSGWGPFSDGPLNAVRKSFYNREGLTEENWMHVAALRTQDAGGEWTQLRKQALSAYRSVYGEPAEEGVPPSPKRNVDEIDIDDTAEVELPQQSKRRKAEDPSLPLGVYEPQTGLVLCTYPFLPRLPPLQLIPFLQTGQTRNRERLAGRRFRTERSTSSVALRLAAEHGVSRALILYSRCQTRRLRSVGLLKCSRVSLLRFHSTAQQRLFCLR